MTKIIPGQKRPGYLTPSNQNIRTMRRITTIVTAITLLIAVISCQQAAQEQAATTSPTSYPSGQSGVKDDESQRNVVQTAIASSDHKTLVAALKAADYVNALSNAGPFTVFAPNDAAFGKLPAGTVDDLVKPQNKTKLRDILEYHVYVGVIRESMLTNNMSLNQVNGKNVRIAKDESGIKVNGANVLGAVSTSNGMIYVIDTVLLPE